MEVLCRVPQPGLLTGLPGRQGSEPARGQRSLVLKAGSPREVSPGDPLSVARFSAQGLPPPKEHPAPAMAGRRITRVFQRLRRCLCSCCRGTPEEEQPPAPPARVKEQRKAGHSQPGPRLGELKISSDSLAVQPPLTPRSSLGSSLISAENLLQVPHPRRLEEDSFSWDSHDANLLEPRGLLSNWALVMKTSAERVKEQQKAGQSQPEPSLRNSKDSSDSLAVQPSLSRQSSLGSLLASAESTVSEDSHLEEEEEEEETTLEPVPVASGPQDAEQKSQNVVPVEEATVESLVRKEDIPRRLQAKDTHLTAPSPWDSLAVQPPLSRRNSLEILLDSAENLLEVPHHRAPRRLEEDSFSSRCMDAAGGS
ncbi:uncharacterized protein LOC140702675 [Pogona vitticeps]